MRPGIRALVVLALACSLAGMALFLLAGERPSYAMFVSQAAAASCLIALVLMLRSKSQVSEKNSSDEPGRTGLHVSDAPGTPEHDSGADVRSAASIPQREGEFRPGDDISERVDNEQAVAEPDTGGGEAEVAHPGRELLTAREIGVEENASRDGAWASLAQECVELFDEIERHKAKFAGQSFELAEHVTSRISEILERNNVELIAGELHFDRRRHQPVGMVSARVKEGSPIEKTISPGFAIGRRVLRRAKVSLTV